MEKEDGNHLKGLDVHLEVVSIKILGIKVMCGKMPGDFLKTSLISWIESNSRTIHLIAMENTLISK